MQTTCTNLSKLQLSTYHWVNSLFVGVGVDHLYFNDRLLDTTRHGKPARGALPPSSGLDLHRGDGELCDTGLLYTGLQKSHYPAAVPQVSTACTLHRPAVEYHRALTVQALGRLLVIH